MFPKSLFFFLGSALIFILGSCQTPIRESVSFVKVTVATDQQAEARKDAIFIKLQHGEAEFIAKTVGMAFFSNLGSLSLRADKRINAIVIGGTAENVKSALKLVLAMDQPAKD